MPQWTRRVRRTVRVTAALARAAMRAELQYRANFLLVTAGLTYQCVGFAFIWVLLERFDVIGGWTLGEVAFLYGLRLTAHGLWVIPFNRLIFLDEIVKEAQFDRFLVRPFNPLLQLMTSRFWLGSFGDIIGGVAILAVAVSIVDIDWSPAAVGYLLLAVVGGALLESSLQLALASLNFRLLSARAFQTTVDNIFSTFGNYPMRIFGGATKAALTFVLPLAFMAYLPATVLLDRTDELSISPWFAYLAPLVGGVWFAAAYRIWVWQMRSYSSAGH